MRHGAADEDRVRTVVEADVVDVPAAPGDQIGIFDPRDAVAEDGSDHGTGDYPGLELTLLLRPKRSVVR